MKVGVVKVWLIMISLKKDIYRIGSVICSIASIIITVFLLFSEVLLSAYTAQTVGNLQ